MTKEKLVVGLTGGIASGKSLVARLFYEQGASKLDADQVVGHCYRHDIDLQVELEREFGKDVFTYSGEVDKERLGDLVFADQKKLTRLEEIVWPYVGREIEEYIDASDGIIIIEASRLYEAGLEARYDKTLVVECPSNIQTKRLMETRGMSRAKAKKIITLQEKSMKHWPTSDYVISNTAEGSAPDYGSLRGDVLEVWHELLQELYMREHSRFDSRS